MNRSHRWHKALGTVLFAALPALSAVPLASADPGPDPAPVNPVTGGTPPPAAQPDAADMPPDVHDAVSTACRQFGAALDLAASNYEDFAYATAGNGNAVDYQNPEVVAVQPSWPHGIARGGRDRFGRGRHSRSAG